MSNTATLAGPGTARAPASHIWTARKVTSKAAAISACVQPSSARAARKSVGVMADDLGLAVGARLDDLGHQNAVNKQAAGILDGIGRELFGDLVNCGVDRAFGPHLPFATTVHFDPHVHVTPSDASGYTNTVRHRQGEK